MGGYEPPGFHNARLVFSRCKADEAVTRSMSLSYIRGKVQSGVISCSPFHGSAW